jgi:hypothetical protein
MKEENGFECGLLRWLLGTLANFLQTLITILNVSKQSNGNSISIAMFLQLGNIMKYCEIFCITTWNLQNKINNLTWKCSTRHGTTMVSFVFLSIIEDKHTQWFERTKGQEHEAKTRKLRGANFYGRSSSECLPKGMRGPLRNINRPTCWSASYSSNVMQSCGNKNWCKVDKLSRPGNPHIPTVHKFYFWTHLASQLHGHFFYRGHARALAVVVVVSL